MAGGRRRPPREDRRLAASVERQEACSRLALARLSHRDVAPIVAEVHRSDRLADELAPAMAIRCDGNPLFLFEHLHAIEDAHVVTRDEHGEWVATGEACRRPPRFGA
jgi:predicted ATPase